MSAPNNPPKKSKAASGSKRASRKSGKGRRGKAKAARPKRRWWVRLMLWGLLLALLGGLVGAGGVAYLLWSYGRELPDMETAQDYNPPQVTRIYAADGSVIDELVDERYIYRTVLSYEQIPQVMRDAMIAAEDADFYSHRGLDYRNLAGAIVRNIRRGELSQGASTITQQVVKNLVLSPERSIRRKVQEALLAFRLEDSLTKDEILTIYLNEVFWGDHYYGVEEASRYYFGHSASELTLPEAALLAGIVQSPNRYNPFRHPEAAEARRSYVLRQLWEKGFIEEGEYREADESPITLADRDTVTPYLDAFPYYTDAVRRELLDHFDADTVFTGGLQVHTAVVPTMQLMAQEAVRAGLRAFDADHGFHTPYRVLSGEDEIAAWRAEHDEGIAGVGLRGGHVYRAVVLSSDDEQTLMGIGGYAVPLDRTPESRMRPDERGWGDLFERGQVFTVVGVGDVAPPALEAGEGRVAFVDPPEAAAVVIDPDTREVQALVGGYDFGESAFNRSVQARRQVGSAFKPFIYGAALDARIATPSTIYLDQPITFPMQGQPDWQPHNYDGRFDGPMTLRTALARSRNVIAVRVLDQVGLDDAHRFARDAGFTSPLTDNLTLALGSAEATPLELTNAMTTVASLGVWGRPVLVTEVTDGQENRLYAPSRELEARLDPAVAWLVGSMMQSVVESGTARRAQSIGHPAAGKTGTTNGSRDAWFVGFTPHLVATVWVGRDDNTPLGRRTSGGATALPIWVDLMTRLHEGREVRSFAEPVAGIVSATVDPASGELAHPNTPGAYTEYFLRGTAPTSYAPAPSERSVNEILLGRDPADLVPDDPVPDEGNWDGF